MAYQSLKFRITGVSPLLLHSGALVDPMNHFAQEMRKISTKREKTDAELEQLSRLEWYGGLYLHEGKPCLPGEVLEAALTEGAKRTKRGRQAQAGIVCRANYPLIYDGPTELEALWQDPAFRLTVGVRVQRNRVMRTRPRFPKWACEFELQYDAHLLNASQIRDIVQRVGRDIGIGDWRPRFGRFEVEP
jgi:hypothetical protein